MSETTPVPIDQGTKHTSNPYWSSALINMVVMDKEEACTIPSFKDIPMPDDWDTEVDPILGIWLYSLIEKINDEENAVYEKTFLIVSQHNLFRLVLTNPDREENVQFSDLNKLDNTNAQWTKLTKGGEAVFTSPNLEKIHRYTNELHSPLFVQSTKGEVILVHFGDTDRIFYCKDINDTNPDIKLLTECVEWGVTHAQTIYHTKLLTSLLGRGIFYVEEGGEYKLYVTEINNFATPSTEEGGTVLYSILKCEDKVLSILTLGSSLFLFYEYGKIVRYTMKGQGDIIILDEDKQFNFHFKLKNRGSAIIVQDLIVLFTDVNKIQTINGKGQVVELTTKQMPLLNMYNYYTDLNDGQQEKKYLAKTYKPNTLNFLGTPFVLIKNTLLNLDNGTFSFLLEKIRKIEEPTFEIDYLSQIVGSSRDGLCFATHDKIFYSSHKYSIEEKGIDGYFTPSIFVSSTKIFPKISKVDGIRIIMQGSKLSSKIATLGQIGIYFIIDQQIVNYNVVNSTSYKFSTYHHKHYMQINITKLEISCETLAIAIMFNSKEAITLKNISVNHTTTK